MRLSLTNTLVALPTYLYLSENLTLAIIPLAVATQLMAMSSQTTNQIIEKEHDKQMIRTQRRPLPSGLIPKNTALLLAGVTYTASNIIFLSCFPIQTALVANAIFFGYIGIYTPLKRYTTINTAVGAIVGALTPFLGFTAAGGSIFDCYPLYYSLYMIFWQFQHFYGISWIYKNDYKEAGFKMCDSKKEALFFMLSSFAINAAANYALFFTNPIYPFLSITYSSVLALTYAYSFAYPAYQFYRNPSIPNAILLKNRSYIHLAVFFLIVTIELSLQIYEKKCKENLKNAERPQKLDHNSLLGRIHRLIFELYDQTNTPPTLSPTDSSVKLNEQSVRGRINTLIQKEQQTKSPSNSLPTDSPSNLDEQSVLKKN